MYIERILTPSLLCSFSDYSNNYSSIFRVHQDTTHCVWSIWSLSAASPASWCPSRCHAFVSILLFGDAFFDERSEKTHNLNNEVIIYYYICQNTQLLWKRYMPLILVSILVHLFLDYKVIHPLKMYLLDMAKYCHYFIIHLIHFIDIWPVLHLIGFVSYSVWIKYSSCENRSWNSVVTVVLDVPVPLHLPWCLFFVDQCILLLILFLHV